MLLQSPIPELLAIEPRTTAQRTWLRLAEQWHREWHCAIQLSAITSTTKLVVPASYQPVSYTHLRAHETRRHL
eukprot:7281180-Prorocentrum_lima.AAC.1